MTLRFTVLGPVAGTRDGADLALGGSRQRTVIAFLLLANGRSFTPDRLAEAVWGPEPASGAIATLRVFLTNLRKAVGDTGWIHFDGYGYRLGEGHDLDLNEFEELRREAMKAPVSASAPLWRAAYDCFSGDPLSGIEDTELVLRERSRLTESRLSALDEMFSSALAAGRQADIVAELSAVIDEHPLRERLRGLFMVALYRQGRQADALRVYREGREHLVDELGLEPGPELRRLERLVLAQSPELDGVISAVHEPSTVDVRSAEVPPVRLELDDGRMVVLSRRVSTLGRGAEADVLLDDPRVSRQHAVIRWRQGQWEVLDDTSTNGTEVNGAGIELHVLHDGDEISLGGVLVRFRTR